MYLITVCQRFKIPTDSVREAICFEVNDVRIIILKRHHYVDIADSVDSVLREFYFGANKLSNRTIICTDIGTHHKSIIGTHCGAHHGTNQ